MPSQDRPHFRFWPRLLPREITLPQTTLWTNLEVAALRYPDKPAFIYAHQPLSYRELKAQAEALAGWLQQQAGIARGDRVLLYMQNCPQFAAAYYSILRADAVVVPVNPMNRVEELAHYLRDTDARAAICAADIAPFLVQAGATLSPTSRPVRLLVTHYTDAAPAAGLPEALAAQHALPEGAAAWTDALANAAAPGAARAGPDDLAVMPYTSGTTGHPKGCMHTHRTVMHNVVGGALWGQTNADTVSLLVLPMFHVTGMTSGLNGTIWAGATAVLQPRWNRDEAAALIARYKVTSWTNISTMAIDLLASPRLAEYDLSSLKHIGGGGAAMPEAVAQRIRDLWGLSYVEGYGLSETIAQTHVNPMDRPKLQCLGIPYVGTDARVVDADTLVELPAGEVGEIIVHGPQVFQGYWRNPDATAAAFVEFDGRRFFRTGDLGRMDEEGYFFITDRLKRMINASGLKVWPAEVETLLFKHPAIQEACVIGARDARRGETVKAFVVLREPMRGQVTADDIIAWSREHMAAYKVPRIIEFVDALPKSGTGKVMWRALQERQNAQSS